MKQTHAAKRVQVLMAILAAALVLAGGGRFADAAPLSSETVKGDLNAWGTWSMTDSLGGTFVYESGQIIAASSATSGFKFFKDSNQWFSNQSTISFAAIFTGMNNSGSNGNMTFNHIQNKFYVFKWNGDDKGVVFQLSAAPVTLTGVSRSLSAPSSSESPTVTATTSGTPAAEQAMWLRYTTDGWASSAVVKMTGSGSSYAASIPAQGDGTTVQYYVFSSGNVASISGGDADLMTINYDNNGGSNYSYAVGNPIGDAQALWLDRTTLAWNGTAGSSYKLLYDPDGAINTTTAAATACAFPSPAAPCYVGLTTSGTISGYAKNPNASGLTRLVQSLSADDAKHLLKGQAVVAAYDGSGTQIDVSRVQIQSVLDDLYVVNGTAEAAVLGPTYNGSVPTVRVWAPTAKSVTLKRYATSTGAETGSHPMTLDTASGVWSVTAPDSSWDRQFYLFDVEVYVPSVDGVVHNLATDPYAVNLSADSTDTADPRSQLVNLADADLKPTGWDSLTKPSLTNFEDSVIYEMHVRDFSINDPTVNAADRGTFMAFTYDGGGPDANTSLSDGMEHLLALKDAGLTHVHLLPAFDIASVPENSVPRTVSPAPTGFDRDAEDQQSAVGTGRAADGFNWGYDPYHYGAPEGSYSTNADGVQRIIEFRRMVSALNQNELRVVMDVVYNHAASSGQDDKSVLDKVVPGYYFRYTTDGALYNSSCCSDTAAEYAMFEKLMIETLERWATDYKVDGFRFDLMNLHTKQNMLDVQTALNAIDPDIYLYGEGWDFGSAMSKGLTTCPNCYAQQANMGGTGIGLFNDKIRDAAHGGYSTDSTQIRKQGFTNGLSYDWNGYSYDNRDASDLSTAMDIIRSGLRGSGTDWNGSGSPFTDDPQESVPYISKHDNETLFDQNVFKLPSATSLADRVRTQNMGLSVIGLSQGVPFFHMASDILRSKSLDRNSYDSGDWFNRVDWSYGDGTYSNNFGVGLPPAWDNSSRWSIMSPLLANTALDPAATDAQFSAAHMREILRIRQSSPLFRLTTEGLINDHTSFYASDNSKPGLIAYALKDGAGLDPTYETILVFFNANKIQQSVTIAGADSFSLHPIHTDGTDDDPVVQTATFDDATDIFTIPARTTVVFVSDELILPASAIEKVELMWPRGGQANLIDQGAFGSANFDIYVQVYDTGVTEAAGQGAGISCSLHWGKYGATWSDVTMTYNMDKGSNDEYTASLSQAAINALGPGTYGFTAFCQKSGEGKQWKSDSYDINSNSADDDQGDGLITIVPTVDSSTEPTGGVFAHLFEWTWSDVQKECPYLASKGYTGVQVSPPNEHVVPEENQNANDNADYPWWIRYQPVSHDTTKFTSRSGNLAQFQAMVDACNAVGVDVIVDAVFNQMAVIEVGTPPTGTSGTEYDNGSPTASTRFYGSQYDATDFHTDCDISSYADRSQVQRCKLSGMPDLDTGKVGVQAKIRAYLQSLIDMGVKGFRIDAAKHMAAQDIAAILDGLTGEYYLFQEVIDQSASEPVRDGEFTPNGDVTEFAYAFALGAAFDDSCGGSLSDLQTLGAGMLPSRFAQVFTDNHDNQRGHGVGSGCILDHRDGQEHVLANIFALAYPYGHPSVMSSYYWSNSATDNTGDSMGPPTVNGGPGSSGATLPVYTDADFTPDNCSETYAFGKWACEHRRTAVANMVQFRQITAGESVGNWQNVGGATSDHIAFGLGTKGFVAINRTASAASTTYQTGLAAGAYCDVTQGELASNGTACTERTITVDGSGQIVSFSLGSMDAFALHTGQKVRGAGDPVYGWWSWSAVGGAASYRVLRMANDPYFAPDPSSQPMWITQGLTFYDPDAATGSTATNHFYVVQALDENGDVISTQRVGEFTFGLTPGS